MIGLLNKFYLLCAVLGGGIMSLSAHAQPSTGLVDLSPQRYSVADVPRDNPQSLPTPENPPDKDASAVEVMVLYHWADRSDLFLGDGGQAATSPYRLGLNGRLNRVRGSRGHWAPLSGNGLGTWARGARQWRYLGASGVDLTLGNTTIGLPAWGQSVSLAGVGLSRALPDDRLAVGMWDYSVAAGALDAPSAAQPAAEGDLAYGSVAGDAVVRYALDPRIMLSSRLQGTSGLATWGLGGAYSMGQVGTWQLGVSAAHQAQDTGLRGQVAYTLGLTPGLDFSWVHVQQSSTYADLASVGSRAGCACTQDQWQLGLAAGRWGAFSGEFEQQVQADGVRDQQVGLSHSLWLGPHLKMHLETNQNLTSRDYGWGAGISVPLW